MGKLSVFNFITLNGFYKDASNDIHWHQHGKEEGEFSGEMLKQNNILLFGRTTYEMMYSFWPTEMALSSMPEVAKGMNNAEKIVFSNTLKKAEWKNTTIIKNDVVSEIRQLKKTSKKDLTILGSGSIVAQFAEAGLIDTFQFMIDPTAIGKGTSLFSGLKEDLNFTLTETKVFKSGSVLLCYKK
ncbi:dihydrofolate reductase family protein [Cytophaga aurantiaca]|uniref:dihydrofolate reductase family protein n=1 Tax=Cytophaga aurantiaca TaxID=29530 RepID=UPI00036CA841|nr:dihydrofolate reductase family protein [Cytophaga aurantiaca]